MTTVYLAGPINGRTDDECNGWRSRAKALLTGCNVLDPMRRDYRGKEVGNAAEIVRGDKQDIDQSDVVLVWYDRPSVGTSMEIMYAWERFKRVIVVNAQNDRISPWIVYHGEVVPFLETAAEMILTGRKFEPVSRR